MFQSHDDTQDTNKFQIFQVLIGNAEYVESFKFQNDAPILKYFQKSLNRCCFSILVSAFAIINHNKTANTISLRIMESLQSEVVNHGILKNEKN